MSTIERVRVCSIDGCERAHYARGWCQRHYGRWRRNGDPTRGVDRPRRDPTCTVEGCNRRHSSHGFCTKHAYRWKQHGDPEAGEARDIPDGWATGRGMAELAGIIYRQLDYWANSGFIPGEGRGAGCFRFYPPEQQDIVCTFARLVDLGFRPDALADHDADTLRRLLDSVRSTLGIHAAP